MHPRLQELLTFFACDLLACFHTHNHVIVTYSQTTIIDNLHTRTVFVMYTCNSTTNYNYHSVFQ